MIKVHSNSFLKLACVHIFHILHVAVTESQTRVSHMHTYKFISVAVLDQDSRTAAKPQMISFKCPTAVCLILCLVLIISFQNKARTHLKTVNITSVSFHLIPVTKSYSV